MTSDHGQPRQRRPTKHQLDQARPGEARPGQARPGETRPHQERPDQQRPDQQRPGQRRPDQAGAALPAGLTTRPAIIRDADISDDFAGELPGDPACLLRRVCQNCGGVADSDPPAVCPQCGAELPGT